MTASEVINPATEEVLRTVERVDGAGVDDAVSRARVAQRRWAALAPAFSGVPTVPVSLDINESRQQQRL